MRILYTSQVCPFAHRPRLAVAAKGIEHQRIEIDLRDMPQWYKDLCPTAKVPMIEHHGKFIWESALINEYLEEVFPDRPLWPHDPFLKARGRIAIEVAGSGFIPAFYKGLGGNLPEPQKQFEELFAGLEDSMVGDGPFWLGEYVSLTDLAIYPWFERWVVLEHYQKLQGPKKSRLSRWRSAMEKVQAVKQERTDSQLYIKGYVRYAPAPATK